MTTIIGRAQWGANPRSLPTAQMRLPATEVFMGELEMAELCAVEDCDQPRKCRGWCAAHYGRWKRHGDPLISMRVRDSGDPPTRFWAKVDVGDPAECWPWIAKSRADFGYGLFRVDQRTVRAHRFVYELVRGPIPEGLFVCHHCDNPPCCNPTHLFLGTNSDNLKDAASKGRIRGPYGSMEDRQPCGTAAGYQTHCRYGEPPCDDCREAHNETSKEAKRRWRARQKRPA